MSKLIRRQFTFRENTDKRACQLAKDNGYVTSASDKPKPVEFILSIFRWVLTIEASEDMHRLRQIKGNIGVVEALKEAWRTYCEMQIKSPPKR